MIKGIVFDVDGTLLDTLPLCLEAFQQSFYQYTGKKYDRKAIADLFGPSEEGVIKRIVPHNSASCLQYFLNCYKQLHQGRNPVFPGIISILKLLKKHRIKRAIVTGKGPKSLEISLEQSGLNSFFSEIYSGEAGGPQKSLHLKNIRQHWKMTEDELYYVGDTPSDIIAAHKAGLSSIAALWSSENYYTDDILAENPDRHFYTTGEFKKWLEQTLDNT